ncbi:MAG: hypothetical protein ACREDR_11360 [Blastocatellia bacterium]
MSFRRLVRMLIGVTLAVALNLAVMAPTSADGKRPISKSGLLEAVRLNGLSTKELIERVRERGVSFQLSDADAKEFGDAGARPELIQAIRENYRAETPQSDSTDARSHAGRTERDARNNSNVPPGPPLSQDEIVTLLQSGVPSSRVEQFVEVRGVAFSLTPAITGQIKRAGGSTSLIGAIAERTAADSSGSSISRPSSRASGPDYDQLTDQATAALVNRNFPLATNLLTQAIKLDPGKSAAFSLFGYSALYGSGNVEVAGKAARLAMDRGGSGVFRVYHDHTGSFSSFCLGSFFVSKTGVTFKADNGVDTFEASKEGIKETKLNGLVGAQYGAFHIKVVQAGGGTRNYNFAPATKSKAEANLIVGLIATTN